MGLGYALVTLGGLVAAAVAVVALGRWLGGMGHTTQFALSVTVWGGVGAYWRGRSRAGAAEDSGEGR